MLYGLSNVSDLTRGSIMNRKAILCISIVFAFAVCFALVGCGSGSSGGSSAAGTAQSSAGAASSVDDLKNLRQVSWEGNEVTVTVGENKTTGCNWSNKFENDKIVDYSTNRKFKVSGEAAKQGISAGTLSMGFKGKSAGTAKVYCMTDKDWDGNTPGYSFAVVVTVKDDGTIASATIEG